jgi:integrase
MQMVMRPTRAGGRKGEIVELFRNSSVMWVLDGRRVKPGTPGAEKVVKKSSRWYGKYKDARTGCWTKLALSSDKGVSKRMLAKLVAEGDAEKAGLVDPFDRFKGDDVQDYLPTFKAYLKDQGDGDRHIENTARLIDKVLDAASIKTLGDLAASYEAVSEYLTSLPVGPRTKNTYRQAIVSFAKYLTVEKKRLSVNPLMALPVRPVGDADKRRKRRALSSEQLQAFVRVVTTRPLVNAQEAAQRRKYRPSRHPANLAPETVKALEQKGRERALLYATAASTGFREGELSVLRVCDLQLDGLALAARLPGSVTKNGRDATIPLTPELAAALREWITEAGRAGTDAVFNVPGYSSVMRAWKKDLRGAGIPYRDDRGRVFDFHSLRKCLGTFLRLAGVDPATSMKLMRHSDIRLTMQVYNDDELQELAPVVNALPRLTF